MGTRHLLAPRLASVALHAAAVPFAAVLSRASCPLLDSTAFGGVGGAMAAALGVACAGWWALQSRWSRHWRDAADGREVGGDAVEALFRGPLRGVLVHVGTFLAGAAVAASMLRLGYGHDVLNARLWISTMLVAGFVAVLHAVAMEWLLARDLARLGSSAWRYRAPAGIVSLDDVVLFAVATLPVGVTSALVHRRVVLEAEVLTAAELVELLLRQGAVVAVWAVATVALLRSVQRRAAAEALALIRELDKAVIPRRANLTTGGPWGETASALNVAADSLEQRARLERAVRVYVGDELAEGTRTADVTETRPSRRRMTVLFADIRGFTARSAAVAPEDVVSMLDGYFERAVAAVQGNGGHVDKFLGDGLMAWFDETPGTSDLGAARAAAAARDLLGEVEAFNADLARRGIAPIEVGVGLHAGDVVRGNLGAGGRKQWTVIGDTVNLASRMESMTKSLGRGVLLTAPVASQLAPDATEPLGDHEIRGQPAPVACFALRTGRTRT